MKSEVYNCLVELMTQEIDRLKKENEFWKKETRRLKTELQDIRLEDTILKIDPTRFEIARPGTGKSIPIIRAEKELQPVCFKCGSPVDPAVNKDFCRVCYAEMGD